MRIICSWCEKYLGDKEPLSDLAITGAICGECYEMFRAKIEKPGEKFLREGGQDDKSEK